MLLLYRTVKRQENWMRIYQYSNTLTTGTKSRNFPPSIGNGGQLKEIAMKGIQYDGAYLIAWVWYFSLVLVVVVFKKESPTFLHILNSIFLLMQGVFNAMVYFKKTYQCFCNNCCHCYGGREGENDNDDEFRNYSDDEAGNNDRNEFGKT